MKSALVLLPALAALCSGAALPQDVDLAERDQGWNWWKRQVIVTVTKTTTKTTAPGISTTSTKYTTLPVPVITKTQTVTKSYSQDNGATTVIVTVTGNPTTLPPSVVTVTVTAKTSSSVKPPITVTVTVAPPEETEEPEPTYPGTTSDSWQITRTLPPLTFGKRGASPAPEPNANPQGWGNRPTRWGNWGPGGQTTVVQTIKETVTYYPPSSTNIIKTITITPSPSSSGSTKTIYYTPPPPEPTSTSIKTTSTVYITSTVVPTISAGPITVTKTYTPTPTPKSTVKSTITIWDAAKNGKRSPQTLGLPSRTGGLLPTETEYPDPEEEDPEWQDPEYEDPEPTYVLGTPSRTVNVSPTPVRPTFTYKPPKPTTTKKPTSYIFPSPSFTNSWSLGQPSRTVNVSPTPVGPTTTKKPWWYSPPKTVTVTKWLPPKPTGTLIVNTATLPVLTLRDERGESENVVQERQGGLADATRSATFVGNAPVKTVPKSVAGATSVKGR